MKNLLQYKTFWDKQAKETDSRNERLRKQALELSHQLKDILVKNYRVKKVILYGSILRPGDFYERSDIVMAVEGLPKRLYFKALGELMFASKFDVDIKPMEDVKG
ncbi:MAG: hypothetical protein HZA19_06075, partial [Nitrospirae bacterium]|nr:hypothetical protein [Nitrospirota bacterium]